VDHYEGGGDGKMIFQDMREWMALLRDRGMLKEIAAEVDWNCEIGAILRAVCDRSGPAILFSSIRDYAGGPCTKLFSSALARRDRLALMLGLPTEVPNSDMLQHVMRKYDERIPPKLLNAGPVKENIIRGDEVNLFEFPVPKWHHLDGGRYINTFSSIVTRDPETGVQNVGLYRGMIGSRNTIPSLLIMGQHWGHHFAKYCAMGKPMPVAGVCGTEPIVPFIASSPIPAGVCEYDVMGAFRGAPMELVRCETCDLEVPATAEIVFEGSISADPTTFELEGPFAEYTGYIGNVPTRRHVIRVSCITHRNDPIFRGTLAGTLPGSYSETAIMSAVQRAALAWNILKAQGVPGVLDVYIPPVTVGTSIAVKIRKTYQGQAKHVAAALWGSGAAMFRYKNVIVADEDIDVTSYEALDWAFAYRVDPGGDDIQVFRGSFGSNLDPSSPIEDRDVAILGAGLWNRLLIDATKNWKLERRPEWGGDVYPPTVAPAPEHRDLVKRRWKEYGLDQV